MSENGSELKRQLAQGLLLSVGAVMAGAAYAVAGWLVGLFGSTLPLPPGTQLATTVALFSIGLFYLVFSGNEDGETPLEGAVGRFGI